MYLQQLPHETFGNGVPKPLKREAKQVVHVSQDWQATKSTTVLRPSQVAIGCEHHYQLAPTIAVRLQCG